jgi:hypothetical protein
MPIVRAVATAFVGTVAVLLLLSGCSGGSTGTADKEPEIRATPTTAGAATTGTTVKISVTDKTVDPSGTKVEVKKGEPVTLLITATVAGELHVHSSPEEHVEFPKGTSAAQITLKQPGIVDVEDHHLNKLIVQLEVR